MTVVLPDVEQMLSYLHGRSAESIRQWVSTERRRLRNHMEKLDALHNAVSLVNKIPNEIFVCIIRHATACSGQLWLIRTAGVCHHWKETIEGTPLLWSDISLLMDPRLIERSLTHSRNSNIDLSFRPFAGSGSLHCSTLRSLLEPHYARMLRLEFFMNTLNIAWRHALAGSEVSSLLRDIAEAVLPRLVSMIISASVANPFTLHLMQNHHPNIRFLSLSGVVLHWESWPLPHLSYMRLADVIHRRADDDDGAGLTSVLDVLESCTLLETFIYECTRDRSRSEARSTTANRSTVLLPKMQFFCVLSTQHDDISTLLAHASLPIDARINFYTRKPFSHPPSHTEMLLSFMDIVRDVACQSALQHVRHASVMFGTRRGPRSPTTYRIIGD